ncbi:hypothetical protein BDF20DRAFT_868384 [Mycotypha africana]|uniref:uncharacterized protein n=1 Tax=Mycotypha africana TaxID=64632 RepID=UPI002301519A|nr:uncharacterized protein BDF20DRAFT_868384 [Mycotypha africana]KAI8979238.1 hypothetical protein BDF20DRAFT_868384 [Mycotypha africana]
MSEDNLEDWEVAGDFDDLSRKNKNKASSANAPQQKKPANTATTPIIIHTNTEASYTHYKPEIKVLKRPDPGKNGSQSGRNENNNKKQPIYKTLAEKEKAYEEARRRIFNT